MAFSDLSDKLQEIADRLDAQAVDVAVVQSMTELLGDFKQRVFVDGLDSEGNKLGTYSEKPNYYTKDQFVRKSAFKAQGKDSDENSKTGVIRTTTAVYNINTQKKKSIAVKKTSGGGMTERTSMYLPQGYKEFRQIQGRQTEFVDLDYSGSLNKAYRVFKFGDTALMGQNDAFEHKKIEGLTDKYGDFQSLTDEEKKRYAEYLGEQVKLIVNNG